MSESITHYLGIGYKLDYDKNTDKIDAFLDKHPEYSEYQFENPNADKRLQIIVDGMNGNYIYIMYVLRKADQEDMYSSSADANISLINTIPESDVALAARRLYHRIFPDENVQNPYLISLFHYS